MATTDPSTFTRSMDWGTNRTQPRLYGHGSYGSGVYSSTSRDSTRYAWSRVQAAVSALLLGLFLAGAAQAADTLTTNLNLIKPDVNVEDPVTPWGTKLNNNSDILDLAICDKRTNCAIVGNFIIIGTGSITSNAFSVGGSTFRVTAGRVGIGLTNPAVKLHLSSGTLWIIGNDSENDPFRIGESTMIVKNDGKTGIGTSIPAVILEAEGEIMAGTGATKSTMSAAGFVVAHSYTKVEFDALTPGADDLGGWASCSDCTKPYAICMATAAVLSGFRQEVAANDTTGCGSAE